MIITNPDAPHTLVEDISGRTQTALQFSWQNGASNGGSDIIDYRVYMAAGEDSYILIKTGHTSTSFFIDTLTPGIVYGFKVKSRNAYGLSLDSEELLILCATVP